MTKITIITIGDELLIGQVIDTNSAWMAQELNKEGLWVNRRVAIGDNREEILKTLAQESQVADVILITGGLGPTADDITKPVLCEYFNTRLVVNAEALENVKNIFSRVLQRPMPERNLLQAEVPESCTVIQNKRGTAPGMQFQKEGKLFISMPGVPHEMKGMMLDDVIPDLTKRFGFSHISHRTLLTAGVGESVLADHLQGFESSLPENIKMAYLPNYGMVRLRLTGTDDRESDLEVRMDDLFSVLKTFVREWIVSDADISLQEAIGQLLVSENKSLCTAESCTGGYVASLITGIPGSSAYFKGSVISYDNQVKTQLLGVPSELIEEFGAVSEETVKAMITGVLNVINADYAIATSGIMGPGGGSEKKPVGTVWIAAGNRELIQTQKLALRFDRQRNIELTATNVLNLLRRFMHT